MEHVRQDPTAPDFIADPYPFYDTARALGEIVFWEDYDLPVATTHRAVSALLRDRRLGREAPEGFRAAVPDHLAPFYAIEDHSMLELDGPRHARLRRQVLTAFTSSRVAALAPRIEALCHGLLDAAPADPFDLVAHYAAPLPVRTIAPLIGLPEDMAEQLLRWSHDMVGMYQAGRTRADEEAAASAASAFAGRMRAEIAARRTAPRDDMLSALVAAEDLDDAERVATAILLMNAGHEATVHALGNAVIHLAGRGAPAPGLADELLRLDPPLHLFTRWVHEDAELFGHPFRRGQRIGLLLGAANRDPKAYPDPDRLDPSRAGPTHTAFGAGAHFCLGAPLARLEIEIALRVLFERHPDLALAEPAQIAPIYHFRGPARLMVARQSP